MFWIFGGGFFDGTGNDDIYGLDFLIEQNVILVTINYRVGKIWKCYVMWKRKIRWKNIFHKISAFICNTQTYRCIWIFITWYTWILWKYGFKRSAIGFEMDIPKYWPILWRQPKNHYFWWQRRQWKNHSIIFIEKWIKYIIILGGISTHFQVLSNESRKYINNAIVMSGTADSIWSLSEVNDHTALAYRIAADAGEPKSSVEELIEFFKRIPAEQIKYTAMYEGTYYRTMNFKFAPVVESRISFHIFRC